MLFSHESDDFSFSFRACASRRPPQDFGNRRVVSAESLLDTFDNGIVVEAEKIANGRVEIPHPIGEKHHGVAAIRKAEIPKGAMNDGAQEVPLGVGFGFNVGHFKRRCGPQ